MCCLLIYHAGSLLCCLQRLPPIEAGSPASCVRSVALRPALAGSLPFSADCLLALRRGGLRSPPACLDDQRALNGLRGNQLFFQKYIPKKLLRELRLL